jgi:class 3 adenylate cyclase
LSAGLTVNYRAIYSNRESAASALPLAGCSEAFFARAGRTPSPESYTPKHLAEKILTSKAALEGERKQVTVLFADLKGSVELLADRDLVVFENSAQSYAASR